ncbi:uncharacterized protein DUF4397 [Pedobacter psychrotolerans]|uniref:Uncharacterized protein DUF4397 n=1 Tax=Pedobacter psychrotolerans TaxID=1843235 RepID=A0A4R2H5J7_9SPHI|nr:DUF4397 domain-containing protein [Pedobacter psychrotolerans]TCO20776.1 uncharacterized protein DUF4397 [Pedobacter psychrotolerans]GGE68012.1 hypothetical protein GCM10011413_38340 [Pedobacter psychrotolerans]
MKTKNYLGLSTKIICALFAITLTFSACKKDWNDDPIEAAGIGFVHASPGTAALDYILDNQKIGSFTYNNDKGYFAAYPGTRLVGVSKKDSLKYLTNGTAALKGGSFYSVFVVDTLKSTKLLLVEDDLKAPETDKAKIRFINLSPGSSPFDLQVSNTDPASLTASFLLTTNKAFKDFSAFSSINPSISYNFEIRQTGTTAAVANLNNVKIEKGKIYTIWAKGLKTATDSTKLSLSIMTNK